MSQFSILGLIFGLLANGPNDLLDYIPSDAYWAQKGVVVSVETMTQQFQLPPASPPAGQGPKATAVRHLMAIRALGESNDPKALEVLKPLLASKEMFEADYAAAAMQELLSHAVITGIPADALKPYIRPQPDAKARAADLNLLPDHLDLVAQAIQLRPAGKTPTVNEAIKVLTSVDQGGGEMTRDEFIAGAIKVAERVGNLRVDSLTLGLSEDVGQDTGRDVGPRQAGFVILILRGQYDPEISRTSFLDFPQPQTQGFNLDLRPKDIKIEGIPALSFFGDLLGLFPDPPRLVLVFGMHGTPPEAVTAVAKALKTGAGTIAQDEGMARLLKQVDTTKPIWAIARVNDIYRQFFHTLSPLAAFTSVTATAQVQGLDVQVTVTATGSDAAKVKAAVADINRFLTPLAAELSGGLDHEVLQMPGLRRTFADTLASLESMKVTATGTQATGSATIKNAQQTIMLIPSAVFYLGKGWYQYHLEIAPRRRLRGNYRSGIPNRTGHAAIGVSRERTATPDDCCQRYMCWRYIFVNATWFENFVRSSACPYIKVDVEFELVGDEKDLSRESPQDRITKISEHPFLELAISD